MEIEIELVGGPWDGQTYEFDHVPSGVDLWCGGVDGIPFRTAVYLGSGNRNESGRWLFVFDRYEAAKVSSGAPTWP